MSHECCDAMREEEKETRGVRITRFIFGRHNGEIRRQDQRKIEEFDIESESALASETAFEQYAGQRSAAFAPSAYCV